MGGVFLWTIIRIRKNSIYTCLLYTSGAGACALLLEWGIVRGNVPAMDSITIQRYLIRGANRLNIFDYPLSLIHI